MESSLILAAESRVKENNLLKVHKLIDWNQLRLILNKIDRSGPGPNGYDTLKLLKALILQAWYSLSDVDLEESLRVRLDFLLFTKFDGDVPDSTTICRFRNLLISKTYLKMR
jgi:IS5 family transposase